MYHLTIRSGCTAGVESEVYENVLRMLQCVCLVVCQTEPVEVVLEYE
jgi:hypothetical protein